jgi:anaerobic selenocysteine-containing dehydrogenase
MLHWLQRVWRSEHAPDAAPEGVGPKGTGRLEPIGWEEALGDIANRLNTNRGRDGGGGIL